LSLNPYIDMGEPSHQGPRLWYHHPQHHQWFRILLSPFQISRDKHPPTILLLFGIKYSKDKQVTNLRGGTDYKIKGSKTARSRSQEESLISMQIRMMTPLWHPTLSTPLG